MNNLKNQCGWVILVGMPGCGKTVLASRMVRDGQLIDQIFPGGITWLTLGNLTKLAAFNLRLPFINRCIVNRIITIKERT